MTVCSGCNVTLLASQQMSSSSTPYFIVLFFYYNYQNLKCIFILPQEHNKCTKHNKLMTSIGLKIRERQGEERRGKKRKTF